MTYYCLKGAQSDLKCPQIRDKLCRKGHRLYYLSTTTQFAAILRGRLPGMINFVLLCLEQIA